MHTHPTTRAQRKTERVRRRAADRAYRKSDRAYREASFWQLIGAGAGFPWALGHAPDDDQSADAAADRQPTHARLRNADGMFVVELSEADMN